VLLGASLGHGWPQGVAGSLRRSWMASGYLWSRGVAGGLGVVGGLGVLQVAMGGCRLPHGVTGHYGGPDFMTSVTFIVKKNS
jgi:hypothetical protein